jgi:ammonium transporter Rh
MYAVFVRYEIQNNPDFNVNFYTYFQDIHLMVLVGFGFLMTFIRRYAWSALAYTFFINSLVIQLYVLVAGFWDRVFFGWDRKFIFIS